MLTASTQTNLSFVCSHRHFACMGAITLLTSLPFTGYAQTTIGLCDHGKSIPANAVSKQYFAPNGKTFSIVATDRSLPGCKTVRSDIDFGNIDWIDVISTDLANRLAKGVVLQTTARDDIEVTDISPLVDDPSVTKPPHYLPTDTNLIATVERTKPFGVEERADIRVADEKLLLSCKAGSRPAGAIIELAHSDLRSTHALRWRISYRSTSAFTLGIANRKHLENEKPFWEKNIPTSSAIKTIDIEVPDTLFSDNQQVVLSLVCPQQSSEFDARDFRLIDENDAKNNPSRSVWVWQPFQWIVNEDSVLKLARQKSVRRIFISVVVDETASTVNYRQELSRFIGEAHTQGMQVWIVEGDPYAVLPNERERFTRRTQIISAAFADEKKFFKPDGLQYDIEPYLIPGYRHDEQAWLSAYLDTLAAIKSCTTFPVEAVVPYWWLFSKYSDRNGIYAALTIVDSLNIMLYRTRQDELQRLAQPILDIGNELKKPISIALENGPIDDENLSIYAPSPSGDLWMAPLGNRVVLLGLKRETKASTGTLFRLRHQRKSAAANITFYESSDRLWALIPELERVWSRWPSFNGISIHGLIR